MRDAGQAVQPAVDRSAAAALLAAANQDAEKFAEAQVKWEEISARTAEERADWTARPQADSGWP